MLNWLYGTAVTYTLAPLMLTLQVLPTRTFSVKLSVRSLIEPDRTSNAAIWSRAGGAISEIGAVFALLFVGQPLGPGALLLRVPFVAATPAAVRTASAKAVTTAMIRGLDTEACRNV
jgi:hypothetical protein